MAWEIVLKRGGRIQRRMGDYGSQKSAVGEAQVLADAAAKGVKVYVQKKKQKRNAGGKLTFMGFEDPHAQRREAESMIEEAKRWEIESVIEEAIHRGTDPDTNIGFVYDTDGSYLSMYYYNPAHTRIIGLEKRVYLEGLTQAKLNKIWAAFIEGYPAPRRRKRNSSGAGKKPTYKAGRLSVWRAFGDAGWTLSSPSLKVLHATFGKTRLWFKPQAILVERGGAPWRMGEAHTLAYGLDLREVTNYPAFVSAVERRVGLRDNPKNPKGNPDWELIRLGEQPEPKFDMGDRVEILVFPGDPDRKGPGRVAAEGVIDFIGAYDKYGGHQYKVDTGDTRHYHNESGLRLKKGRSKGNPAIPKTKAAFRKEYYGLLTKYFATRQYIGAGKYEMPTAESQGIGARLGEMYDAHPTWADEVDDQWGDDQRMNPKGKKPNPPDRWLHEADEEIEEAGTEGAFTKQARKAGYSDTMDFARKVMAGWRSGKKTVLNKKTRRQQGITKKTMYRANFAINAQKRNPRNPKNSDKGENYAQLFRDLRDKRIETVQLDMEGVMGGGTGGFRTFKRGRMGKPKRWSGGRRGPYDRVSMSVVPLDDMGNPIKMRSGYKLWLSEYDDGTADVSASIGDMGIMIEGMKNPRTNSMHDFKVSEREVSLVIDDLKGRKGKVFVGPLMKRTGLSNRAVLAVLEDRLGYYVEGMDIGKPGFIRRQNPAPPTRRKRNPGKFFVIVDHSVPGGEWHNAPLYGRQVWKTHELPKADAEAARLTEKTGRDHRVIDAEWFGPSRSVLEAQGWIARLNPQKRQNPAPHTRRRNTHLKKGETAKFSQSHLDWDTAPKAKKARFRIDAVYPRSYNVTDLATGKYMSLGDHQLVAADSSTRKFPGTGYKGKTPNPSDDDLLMAVWDAGWAYGSAGDDHYFKVGRRLKSAAERRGLGARAKANWSDGVKVGKEDALDARKKGEYLPRRTRGKTPNPTKRAQAARKGAATRKRTFHPDNPTSYLKADQKPLRWGVLTAGYGKVSVYEDPKYGDMEPLVVIDQWGNEVPNDYYDMEDISTLHPDYADDKQQAAYVARSGGRTLNPRKKWDQVETRCTRGTEGNLKEIAEKKGYKTTLQFAKAVMKGWGTDKKVYNKKTKGKNRISKELMQSANFTVNSQAVRHYNPRANPQMTEQQARTIMQQLGGYGRVKAMTGLKQHYLGEDEDGYPQYILRFPNRRGPNVVKISLTPADTYTMRFYRTRKYDLIPKGEFVDVYASQLIPIFEKETGLYLRLNNPKTKNGYFTAYTRPESGFRYFSEHRAKETATTAQGLYKRKGFTNVRITKSRPKDALPAGLLKGV